MSEENSLAQPEVQSPPTATGSVDPQSVEGLFLAALAKPEPDQRRAFLDQACRDEEQRRRVDALLRAYADAGSFLETPAAGRQAKSDARETISPDKVSLDFLRPSDQPGCLGALGPYQVIDVIGRGGMGIVLRALDAKLNRIVAVKVLAPELAANPNARRRFLREAQAAAAVSHPHVVTIHAVDEDKLPYLVMECILGQSLQEKLDRTGSLRLTEILRIGRQVAEGLAAAHQQGLIHRDIKPANILLENGVERVKITDFGLARAADDVAITRPGEVSGTPQYMSPEQARGDGVDHRSDLFSLGCVLYAMCTGRPPFRGDSLAAVIKRLTEDSPRPIAEINPEIPAWLSDVVQRLLEKHPDQRFQTAAELAEVLGTRLANLQVPSQLARAPELAAPERGQQASLPPARVAVLPRIATVLFLLFPLAFTWFLLAGHQHLGMDLDADEQAWLGLLGLPLAAAIGAVLAWALQMLGSWLSWTSTDDASPGSQRWSRPALISVAILAVSLPLGGAALVLLQLLRLDSGGWHPGTGEFVVTIGIFAGTGLTAAVATLLGIDALRRICRSSDRLRGRQGAMAAAWFWPCVLLTACLAEVGRGRLIPAASATWVTLFSTVVVVFLGIVALLLILALRGRHHGPRRGSAGEPTAGVRAVRPWPERLLVWLAILGLTMFVVVPACMIGAGLLYMMLAREKASTAALREQAEALQAQRAAVEAANRRRRSGEPSIVVPEGGTAELQRSAASPPPSLPTIAPPVGDASAVNLPPAAVGPPPGVRWQTKPGVDTLVEGKVQLDVRLLSEGLFVALRRRSSFNGNVAGDEHLATSIGTTYLKLQPGEYEVLVRDERFGWGVRDRGTVLVRETGLSTLTVQRDLPASLRRPEDFHDAAAGVAAWVAEVKRRYLFVWHGQRFELTTGQAVAVQRLATALIAGSPDVPENEVVAGIPDAWRDGETLEQNFRSADGQVPAWGKVVVSGDKPGTYRLAPIPTATLTIDLRTPGMRVSVFFPADSDSSGRAIVLEELGRQQLVVAPGQYRVQVIDSHVHWRAIEKNQPIPSRTENCTLAEGGSVTFVAERRWEDYVPPKYTADEAELPDLDRIETPYRLIWFDRLQHVRNSSYSFFALTRPQAAFVSRLFQGLADGKPDVAEEELLKAAKVQSLNEVFPGGEGQTYEQIWGPLFVPGDQPKTWRLNVPKEAEASPVAG